MEGQDFFQSFHNAGGGESFLDYLRRYLPYQLEDPVRQESPLKEWISDWIPTEETQQAQDIPNPFVSPYGRPVSEQWGMGALYGMIPPVATANALESLYHRGFPKTWSEAGMTALDLADVLGTPGIPEGALIGGVLGASKKVTNAVTDSKAFLDWFGKSKVVDEAGKPLVVYHGGEKGISQFSPTGKPHGDYGVDMPTFTNRKGWAENYAKYADEGTDMGKESMPEGRGVYSATLNIRNPLYLHYDRGRQYPPSLGGEAWSKLKEAIISRAESYKGEKIGQLTKENYIKHLRGWLDGAGEDGFANYRMATIALAPKELGGWTELNKLAKQSGFDGIAAQLGDIDGWQYVPFNGNQIKLANPIK